MSERTHGRRVTPHATSNVSIRKDSGTGAQTLWQSAGIWTLPQAAVTPAGVADGLSLETAGGCNIEIQHSGSTAIPGPYALAPRRLHAYGALPLNDIRGAIRVTARWTQGVLTSGTACFRPAAYAFALRLLAPCVHVIDEFFSIDVRMSNFLSST